MTLSAGSRLGPYEIVARLGAGGMGEVWLARDTRLDRTVAIKTLPAEFATDDRLRMRLEREAKAISSLNHPNICTLYDVGDGDGFPFLVMEYVEGESLAERLARGPLPLEDVVHNGMQIADALERAHKSGIVHRDLKPANIMLTKAGTKLLDFGLAKPLDVVSNADTTTKGLTEEGHIVGTLPYMAPEQVAGGEVDHRTDLFALGAVLSEMATGRRVFAAANRAEAVGGILTREPPRIAPPALDRIVRTCLAKDPDNRFQSAYDVRLALHWIADDAAADTHPRPRRAAPWIAAALAIVTVAMAILLWQRGRAEPPQTPVRLSILPPAGHQFDFLDGSGAPDISPDGTRIVFTATKDGVRKLWIRRLDKLVAEPLAGTDDAINPFWSPNSRSVAFFANDKLMKLDLAGGAPVVICDAPLGRGGSWGADGTILFAGRATPILRVPASGSAPPVAVTDLDRSQGDTTHRWPFFLPDGRHFLYVAAPSGLQLPTNSICVGSLDRKMRKVVLRAASQPLYLDGQLLFVRDDTLHAQRFDTRALAVTGEPVTLSEQAMDVDRGYGRTIVSVSQTGTLVYQMARPVRETQWTWYSRSGEELRVVGEPAMYAGMSMSRDGRFLYFALRSRGAQSNLWSYDLENGLKTRVTFGNTRDSGPVLSPDGKKLVYTSVTPPRQGCELRLIDLGTGTETTLLRSKDYLVASDWSGGGILMLNNGPSARGSASLTRSDLFWLSLSERKIRPYLQTPDIETVGRFSPDGKWVAWQSDQTGPVEVYLTPFPATGAKWQVSAKGGTNARWRADGKELYYTTFDDRLMAVPISLGAIPRIGRPTPLFRARAGILPRFAYAAAPDGQRFLVNTRSVDDPPQPVTVVLHFDDELRAAMKRR